MNKNIKLLFIVFVILTAIAFAPKIKEYFASDEPVKKPAGIDLSLFTPETIQTVTVEEGEKTRTLALKEGNWQINGEEADQNKVNLLFGLLEQTRIDKMVSKNQDNHENYGITKDSGIVVTFAGEGEPNIFIIGKAGPTPDSFYIRKGGIANVYLAQGALRDSLTQTVEQWKPTEEGESGQTGIENAEDMNALPQIPQK